MQGLSLPEHWMAQFFYAHAYLELQMNEDALKIYEKLAKSGLINSTYLKAQTALAWNNLRRTEESFKDSQRKHYCYLLLC